MALPDKLTIALAKRRDFLDFPKLMHLMDAYMRVYPEAWASVSDVDGLHAMGRLTQAVVGKHMAYMPPWQENIRDHDFDFGTSVFPWVQLLTNQYERRFDTLQTWMRLSKIDTLFPE